MQKIKINGYIHTNPYDLGPGEFKAKSTFNFSKAFTLGTKRDEINKNSYIPGPGKYKLESSISATGFLYNQI